MKKRVLQVLGGIGFGGAEAFVMNQFRNMQDEYVFDFAVQVKYDKDKSYEEEITKMGGKIFYTGLFRESPLKFANSIDNIIKRHGPYSAVHIHINEQCGFAALGAKRNLKGNIIVHAHSSQYGQKNFFIKTVMLVVNKVLVKLYANQIVACSKEAARMYFGNNAEKSALILKNPIDVERYYRANDVAECRKLLNISNDSLVLLHIGRFVEVKNHEFIIKICKEIIRTNSNFTMLFVGDGKLRQHIMDLAEKNHLNSHISFLGERSDIPQILGASDILLLPSKYEGLPTVVLEAQASSIKCLASNRISNLCDLGLGLVQFLPIDDENDVQNWITAINNYKREMIEYDILHEAFVTHGIDLDKTSGELRNLYL